MGFGFQPCRRCLDSTGFRPPANASPGSAGSNFLSSSSTSSSISSFVFLLFFLVLILLLSSCRGESDGVGAVIDHGAGEIRETRIGVSAEGEIEFAGSGDFRGITISAQELDEAAGGYLLIEMDPSPDRQNGYLPVGNLYTMSLFDRDGNEVQASAMVVLSIPYKKSVVEYHQVEDELVLLRDGQVQSSTRSADEGVLTATLDGFGKFVVAFQEFAPTARPHPLPLITVGWDGYADADKIDDPAVNPIADPHRGLRVVQIGERVQLRGRDTDVSRRPYTSYSWELLAAPEGTDVVLPGTGQEIEFIPDRVGLYEVQLTASNSVDDTETLTITAGSYSYLERNGDIDNYCGFCHAGGFPPGEYEDIYGRDTMRDLITPWQGSNHAAAYENLSELDGERDNTVCLNCHTTGFLFADRTMDGDDDYPGAWGFDDFVTAEDVWLTTPSDAASVAPHLAGVACEACHGPAGAGGTPPDSSGFRHEYQASLSQGPCMACHNIDPEEEQLDKRHFSSWEGALHVEAHYVVEGQARVADTYPCYNCHVGQYFIGRMHDRSLEPADIDQPEGITCAVCHDPHGESDHAYQLRHTGEVDIPLRDVVHSYEAGTAAVCYSCHNAYIALPAVGEDLHGNQAEMLEGIGGYEYGRDDLPTGIHRFVTDKCVGCHMVAEHHDERVITHQRRLYEGEDIADADDYTIQGCISCHSGDMALPEEGNRFDYRDRFSEIEVSLEELQVRINELAGREDLHSPIIHNYEQSLSGDKLEAVNRAAYNYLFVRRDGSYGIHNYQYAAALLQLSMEDLEGY